MPKPKKNTGEKNLISKNLIEYRKQRKYSQRLLAYKLQLNGYDIDKNVITRIETNNRYVTDIELKALCEVLDVTYDELIDGSDRSEERLIRKDIFTVPASYNKSPVVHLVRWGFSCAGRTDSLSV